MTMEEKIPTIVQSLREDECVLLLGPGAAMFEGDYLLGLLADRMAQTLGLPEDAPRDLSTLTRQLVNQAGSPTAGLQQIGTLVGDFYQEFENEIIPVYEKAAKLPFKYVLNCSPDSLFLNALQRVHKTGSFFSFDYSRPGFNAMENDRASGLTIDEDAPLVFNFLGHYLAPSSLVLTGTDRLRFLDVVLQKEKGTLPENITYHFLRPPMRQLRKTFLFLGFDFSEWHMRMFMHLLRRNHDHLPQSLTLQERGALNAETAGFFSDNFDMVFLGDQAEALLDALHAQLAAPVMAPPPAAMELLLLYHPDDQAWRTDIETHLAPLRNSGLVEVWHEARIDPGDEVAAEIEAGLARAGVIVVLVTAKLLADPVRYRYVEQAVRLHNLGQTTLVPLTCTPCNVIHTPLFDLPTLNPKPRGRAVSQKADPVAALAEFARVLRSILERKLGSHQNNRP